MSHPRDVIIDSMQRTLVVLAYTQWCDEWDQADPYGCDGTARWLAGKGRKSKRPASAVSARGGCDWFDVAPAGPASFRADMAREAAVLYGRIEQAWGADPWLVLHWNGYDETSEEPGRDEMRNVLNMWGHYAIMSLVGHGVSWEDDHDTLTSAEYGGKGDAKEYTIPRFNIDTPYWPGKYPERE